MPSYEEVYEPPMLDETGQDVAAAIRELKSVVQPTNVCVDLDVSLEVSGWSNSAPYTYNWMNNKVTTECAVKVNYLEGAEDTDDLYIGYEKIVGGIQFESPTKPTAAIPVRIHIVNAEADSITNIDDEMVSSNVISGASNVKQALTSLKNADASLSEQIGTLNGKFSTIVMSHGLTAKTNVTLNGAALVACGLLRFYHFYFTPSADINAGTELIEGFTPPYLFLNGGALGIALEGTSRETCSIYLSNAGVLSCDSNLQKEKSYRCSMCYVSNVVV